MTPDRITELAIQAGFVGFDGKTKVLQRFAELVRAEALEEAMRVLEFHGFDDAIPYIKWAAVNGRSKT